MSCLNFALIKTQKKTQKMAGKSKKSKNSQAHLKDTTPLQRWEIVHKLKHKGHSAVVIAETIGLNRRSVHKILKKPKPPLTTTNIGGRATIFSPVDDAAIKVIGDFYFYK